MLEPFARRHILGDDHRLREGVVRQLDIERQVKPDRAAADVSAPMTDIGVALEQAVEPLGGTFAGIDRGVLRQRQVDEQVRPVRRRKELPRDVGRGQDRGDKTGEGHANGEPAKPHRADQKPPEIGEDRARFVGALRVGLVRITTPSNGANSTATIHETISA